MGKLKQRIKDCLVYARNLFDGKVCYKSFLDGQRDFTPESLDEIHEKQLVERIARAYRKAVDDGGDVPPAYRAGGAWAIDSEQRSALSNFALRGELDSLRQELRNFLRRDCSRGLFPAFSTGGRAATVNRLSLWLEAFDHYAREGAFGPDDLADTPMYGNPTCYVMDGKVKTARGCV